MSRKLYHFFPINILAKQKSLSERRASALAKISRSTWRSIVNQSEATSLVSLANAANALDSEALVLLVPESIRSDFSTLGVSYAVIKDGESSWKTHFMNLIDEFRRELDPRLIILPPSQNLSIKLKALLASIVSTLANEAQMDTPSWAAKSYYLPAPWFVSEMESLKASAILESPIFFRKNNIFVNSNFMERV